MKLGAGGAEGGEGSQQPGQAGGRAGRAERAVATRACPRGVLLPSPFPLSAFYFPELVKSKCDDDDDNDDHNDNADDGVITFLRHIL